MYVCLLPSARSSTRLWTGTFTWVVLVKSVKRSGSIAEKDVGLSDLPDGTVSLADEAVAEIVDQVRAQGCGVSRDQTFTGIGRYQALRLAGKLGAGADVVALHSAAHEDVLILSDVEVELGDVGVERAGRGSGESVTDKVVTISDGGGVGLGVLVKESLDIGIRAAAG